MTQDADTSTRSDTLDGAQLTQLRFDYAWKWFEFHATQRTTIFNFMLVSVGILANAVVVAIGDQLPDMAMFLSLVGVIVSAFYFLLDGRNQELVHVGEAVLVDLEREAIFGIQRIPARNTVLYDLPSEREPDVPFGILWAQDQKSLPLRPPSWIEKYPVSLLNGLRLGQHRVIFRLIAVILGVCFAVAAIYVQVHRTELSKRPEQYSVRLLGSKSGPGDIRVIISHGP